VELLVFHKHCCLFQHEIIPGAGQVSCLARSDLRLTFRGTCWLKGSYLMEEKSQKCEIGFDFSAWRRIGVAHTSLESGQCGIHLFERRNLPVQLNLQAENNSCHKSVHTSSVLYVYLRAATFGMNIVLCTTAFMQC
jgi:hypothetical protein